MSDKIIPDRKEYYKNYYKTNKSYWKDEINCKLCNKFISRQSYSKHLKSKVHKLNFLNEKINHMGNMVDNTDYKYHFLFFIFYKSYMIYKAYSIRKY